MFHVACFDFDMEVFNSQLINLMSALRVFLKVLFKYNPTTSPTSDEY